MGHQPGPNHKASHFCSIHPHVITTFHMYCSLSQHMPKVNRAIINTMCGTKRATKRWETMRGKSRTMTAIMIRNQQGKGLNPHLDTMETNFFGCLTNAAGFLAKITIDTKPIPSRGSQEPQSTYEDRSIAYITLLPPIPSKYSPTWRTIREKSFSFFPHHPHLHRSPTRHSSPRQHRQSSTSAYQ